MSRRTPAEDALEAVGIEGLERLSRMLFESMMASRRESPDPGFGPVFKACLERANADAPTLLAGLNLGWALRTESLVKEATQ
jgi:hypothetical protein